MSRTPSFPPKVFYRIKFSSDSSMQKRETPKLEEMIKSNSTSMVSEKDADRFKNGNGLVVASWDLDKYSPVKVHALGIMFKNRATGELKVRWFRPLDQCELKLSTRSGEHYWINPVFKIATSVAKDWELKELFEKHRTDLLAAIP